MVDVSKTPTLQPSPGPRAQAPRDESFLGWRRSDQIVFGTLLIVMTVLMGIHWARMSRLGTQPIELERHEARTYEFKLDINSANWVEWAQLDGIGDQLARRIVADREANGPFKGVDDLNRVPGIGGKTLDKMRPWIYLRSEIDASALTGR